MEVFEIKNLNFAYPSKEAANLRDINLSIESGSFVCLCGKSGCGKTTLLRNLKPTLSPSGKKTGEIFFEGRHLEALSLREQAKEIGFVLQNPDNQIVTDKVWHELAFGLENLGLDNETMKLRVSEMASFFGIQTWFDKDVKELSGGQKQLLNLAAIMAMQPSVLILDEPTSQLDPIAASDFLDTVAKINREIGTTIIMTEHRLEDVMPMADRVIVMEDGQVILDGKPSQVAMELGRMKNSMFLAMPSPIQAYCSVAELECAGSEDKNYTDFGNKAPLDVRGGRQWLGEIFQGKTPKKKSISDICSNRKNGFDSKPIVELKNIWFKYDKNDRDIIKNLSLEIFENEFFAIVGGNGTGKSTTLSLISGINKAYRGKLKIKGESIDKLKKSSFSVTVGVLPQNPQDIFVEKTIELDLMEALSGRGLNSNEVKRRVDEVCHKLDLDSLKDEHPYDVSGGEQQRVALGKILLLNPDILLLDEPTKGLDSHFKQRFAEILEDLKSQGVTIIMVSHDIEFCGRYADRCAMFFDGNITAVNEPRDFFSGNSFYTTSANRMSRNFFDDAVIWEDVVDLIEANKNIGIDDEDETNGSNDMGQPEENNVDDSDNSCGYGVYRDCSYKNEGYGNVEEGFKPHSKLRNVLTTACGFFVMLATLYLGLVYGGDRTYYIVSLLIILYISIPFFISFEKHRYSAKELVLMSVLITIGVVGRQAFFMLPQVKPTLAISIIGGSVLGPRTGFLIGSMIAFVSNFSFGQGPWTPWQMFATGIVGFLAGLIFNNKKKSTNKVAICSFGFMSGFLYGLIVDLWTIFGFNPEPNWNTVITVYGAAVYYNLTFALATAGFLWILNNPLVEKIERIKLKYGLLKV